MPKFGTSGNDTLEGESLAYLIFDRAGDSTVDRGPPIHCGSR